MLLDDIVQHIAANEKAVNKKKLFLSDSEDEKAEKNASRKKRIKDSRQGLVMLKDRPAHCPQSSLDFLKKRKMQVAKSSAVLNNSNQALRLLSSSGLLK
ncbi:Hypothetical predicted protein [Olea europaea subsp. europaea]|uniref:Uncharacterized protein n=1 Tax=Olea europaea subsp. europaea TaxID=158383 RepID=A0A8S0QLR0_OLEEU|nr:Hypothetical predicted protein [Olea europaea subsp. europaea]